MIDNIEFKKKLIEYSLTMRYEEVTVLFRDGFVDEVDLEENTFYYDDGSEESFDNVDEDDFRFFKMRDLEIDLDDVYEFVKFLKVTKKSINEMECPSTKKFKLLVIDEADFIDTLESLERFETFEAMNDYNYKSIEAYEFKEVKFK